MAVRRKGRFGLFGPRFTIADDEVRVTQTPLALLLIPITLGGFIALVAGYAATLDSHGKSTSVNAAMVIGGVVFSIGMFSVIGHTWGEASPIVFSREGIRWGDKTFPIGELRQVRASEREHRTMGGRTTAPSSFFRCQIIISLASGEDRALTLRDAWLPTRGTMVRALNLRDQIARVTGVEASSFTG
jgi:hypothetical protein